MDQANEVQETLGRSYGMPEVDDDELEAELDALGDEIGFEDSSYLDDAIGAPSAPTSEPGAESMRVSLGSKWLSTWAYKHAGYNVQAKNGLIPLTFKF